MIVTCALILIPAPLLAQPGAKCRIISDQIADLKSEQEHYLADNTGDYPYVAGSQKVDAANARNSLASQIAAKQKELQECLSMASPSGGEPFTMQGGIVVTPNEIA